MKTLASGNVDPVATATDEAVADWRHLAPRDERELVEAQEESAAEEVAAAAFAYLLIRHRYRRRLRDTGRGWIEYDDEDVVRALDSFLLKKRLGVADELFQGLRSGQLTLAQAQLIGERELLKAHLLAGMLGKGGRNQMAIADYAHVARNVLSELGWWSERFGSLAAGAPLDGRVLQSFRAFFEAPAVTYQEIHAQEVEKRGFDLWKNRLADGVRHCEPKGGRPSCPSLSREFVSTKKRVPRGRRGCWWHCHCGDIYKNSVTGEIRR